MNDQRCEDRHGEMTGAITIRYILVMPAVAIWCIFIGPLWLSVGWNLAAAVVGAVGLTWLAGPPSRRIWAWISDLMERSDF